MPHLFFMNCMLTQNVFWEYLLKKLRKIKIFINASKHARSNEASLLILNIFLVTGNDEVLFQQRLRLIFASWPAQQAPWMLVTERTSLSALSVSWGARAGPRGSLTALGTGHLLEIGCRRDRMGRHGKDWQCTAGPDSACLFFSGGSFSLFSFLTRQHWKSGPINLSNCIVANQGQFQAVTILNSKHYSLETQELFLIALKV